jgi:hypothetical protein
VFEGVLSGDGRWKLHIPHQYRTLMEAGHDGSAGKYAVRQIELALFDLEADPNETTNVIEKNADVAARLKGYAEEHRREFFPKQAPFL